MPPLSDAVLIYNAGAGRVHQHRLPLGPPLPNFPLPPPLSPLLRGPGDWPENVRARLRDTFGAPVPEVASESFADAERAAREAAASGVGLVIAAGGDGTLRAVTEGLVGTETALGILPRGTVNVLARELGIPLDDPDAALDICLHGETRRIDIGKVGGRHFLLMCSVGFDAQAVADVNPDLKGWVGSPAYLLSGLATFANYDPPAFTYAADGAPPRTAQAFMLVAANAGSYGGDLRIAPEASLTDGLLDVCVFEAPPGLPPPLQRAAFLRQMGAFALGRHRQDPDVAYLRCRRLTLSATPDAPIQIDGDPDGYTPLVVEAVPQALAVRVPR